MIGNFIYKVEQRRTDYYTHKELYEMDTNDTADDWQLVGRQSLCIAGKYAGKTQNESFEIHRLSRGDICKLIKQCKNMNIN